MKINQIPMPPNTWLYKSEIIDGEEIRINWCRQIIARSKEELLNGQCTEEEKEMWDESHKEELVDEVVDNEGEGQYKLL